MVYKRSAINTRESLCQYSSYLISCDQQISGRCCISLRVLWFYHSFCLTVLQYPSNCSSFDIPATVAIKLKEWCHLILGGILSRFCKGFKTSVCDDKLWVQINNYVYKKKTKKTQFAQNGPFQSFHLTWLLENPSSNRFCITLVHEGRPVLKLCKCPGAESTVKKNVKVCNENCEFWFIPVPRRKHLGRIIREGGGGGQLCTFWGGGEQLCLFWGGGGGEQLCTWAPPP